MVPRPADDLTPLNGATGVTRSLLAWTLALMVGLIGVVFGMVQSRINDLDGRLLRLEALVNARGERIAIIEAKHSSMEYTQGRLDAHLTGLESRMREHEINPYPAPPRRLRGDP